MGYLLLFIKNSSDHLLQMHKLNVENILKVSRLTNDLRINLLPFRDHDTLHLKKSDLQKKN